MATLPITFPANSGANLYETGAALRGLAKHIEEAASGLPDKCATGADVVLTFDNTQSGNSAGFFTLAGGNLPATVTKRF